MNIHTGTEKFWWRDILLLTFIVGILFGSFLGTRPLATPDEARYAEIPREMLAMHDFVTPHLNYIKYFEKPALFYWLQAGAIKLFGLQEWSVRLINALMGLLGCLFTYICARKLYGRRCGWLASLILATSVLYSVMARFITVDMTVTTFLSGSLFSFLLAMHETGKKRNYYLWGMYFFSALATLTKGLIGIIFPGMIIFTWILIFNEWRNIKTYCLPTGILLWLLITLPWHILVQLKNPEFFHFYFIQQQFARYLTSYAHREQPMWFLPLLFLIGFSPWIFFLPQAIRFNWPSSWKQRAEKREALFLMLWAILIYLFFQLSHSQLPPYLLPIFPPLAILVGRYLSESWRNTRRGIWIGLIIFASMVTLMLGGGTLIFSQMHIVLTSSLAYLWFATCLLAFAAIAALVAYWSSNLKSALIIMFFGMSVFLWMLTFTYPLFQQKSIKPLAQRINQLAESQDEIMSYHGYYQDLPFYTRRRVILVGWGDQEQEFGMKYQNMDSWLIDDKTLWKTWRSKTRMFLVLSQNEYNALSKKLPGQLHFMAETSQNVLVTNQRIKP